MTKVHYFRTTLATFRDINFDMLLRMAIQAETMNQVVIRQTIGICQVLVKHMLTIINKQYNFYAFCLLYLQNYQCGVTLKGDIIKYRLDSK